MIHPSLQLGRAIEQLGTPVVVLQVPRLRVVVGHRNNYWIGPRRAVLLTILNGR